MEVKHPDVPVQLVGEDGDSYGIFGRCIEAAQRGSVPREKIDEFLTEAKSTNYDHVLRTCMRWFDVV